MRVYYEKFAPDWDEAMIRGQIANLENWDILDNDEVVGALRIEFDNQCCVIRDLQVLSVRQNQGLGAQAIEYAGKQAVKNSATTLALRVLKVSPACRLYHRAGFATISEDERFYYMEKHVS
nr:GNAT family N-acetyltransferase [Marinicella sp. NBU2979]